MNKWQALFLVIFLAPPAFSQILYRAGEKTPAPAQHLPRLEISGGKNWAFSHLKDGAGETMISRQDGYSARGLLFLTSWWAVGAEWTDWKERTTLSGMSRYKTKRTALVTKLLLTPNTQPRAYLILGYGKVRKNLDYVFNWQEASSCAYVSAGAGVEVALFKGLFLAAELQGVYQFEKQTGSFLQLAHRIEAEPSLRAGLRF